MENRKREEDDKCSGDETVQAFSLSEYIFFERRLTGCVLQQVQSFSAEFACFIVI